MIDVMYWNYHYFKYFVTLFTLLVDFMYWNYHYFKYLVTLFTLLGFHLFMLNKYHFIFGYLNWFILYTCMNMFIFNFIVSIQFSSFPFIFQVAGFHRFVKPSLKVN